MDKTILPESGPPVWHFDLKLLSEHLLYNRPLLLICVTKPSASQTGLDLRFRSDLYSVPTALNIVFPLVNNYHLSIIIPYFFPEVVCYFFFFFGESQKCAHMNIYEYLFLLRSQKHQIWLSSFQSPHVLFIESPQTRICLFPPDLQLYPSWNHLHSSLLFQLHPLNDSSCSVHNAAW